MLHLIRLNKIFFTKCMILHPVSFPNKGPLVQQYLAEQAVGLASSLGWEIVKGPYWNYKGKNLIIPTSFLIDQNNNHSNDEIKDGQYVDTVIGRGIKYEEGVMFDPCESQSDGDLHKEWRDKLKRQSIANSSLIKTKRVTQRTFFTKGKLDPIANHIKHNQVDCLFINKELKPTQIRNLTKILQAKINNLGDVYIRPGGGQFETETQFQSQDIEAIANQRGRKSFRRIKIFDRFSIILQIFAQRTTTKLARLQIQLSFLNYLKTKLVRDGSTFSSNLNMFNGDLMKAQQVRMEIISAKQRRALHTMSGEGETQLEIQRRNIRDKQAKIRRAIDEQSRLRNIRSEKSQKKASKVPVIALVGYTNVGKSAFMNAVMKKKETQSKDLLFQTLATTSRYVNLISGRQINLLDTIGFITDLPVELVESFKSTLEQVAHADLVIHLRDVSSPMNQLQKNSVLKILDELKFKDNFSAKNMIEVWNKIDLLNDYEKKQFMANYPDAQAISCLTNQGIKELLSRIDHKLDQITGAQLRTIEYCLSKHHNVVEWIKEFTNLSYDLKEEFNYEQNQQFPKGSVKLNVPMDDATYGKVVKFIEGQNFKKIDKRTKGMPPKGW